MAIPGETVCREVAPCGTETWDGIPVEANTQYVDASYPGSDSDGSEARPWTTIQEGVDAAEPGAIVAVAEGTYTGQVSIADKAVRLWGRCPDRVVLQGTGGYVLNVGPNAHDTELRDLQVTGNIGWAAVGIHESLDVLVDKMWLHDVAGSRGLDLTGDHGPTSVTVSDSLIERVRTTSIMFWGIDATIERSVVREGVESINSGAHRLLNVAVNTVSTNPSTAVVRRCVLEGAIGPSVMVFGSEVTLESTLIRDAVPLLNPERTNAGLYLMEYMGTAAAATVSGTVIENVYGLGIYAYESSIDLVGTTVRDTEPDALTGSWGWGVTVQDGSALSATPEARLEHCSIEGSVDTGVALFDATATLDGVRIRDTRANADGEFGRGAFALAIDGTGVRPALTLRGSVVESCFTDGILADGADLVVERSIVQDVAAEPATGQWGAGIVLTADADSGPSRATLSGSLVQRTTGGGVRLFASHATIERSIVRAVYPRTVDRMLGQGVAVYPVEPQAARSTLAIHGALIEQTFGAGLLVYEADATVEGSIIRATAALAGDETLGDAVSAAAYYTAPQVRVMGSVLEGASRAGLSNFGGGAEIGFSRLECNPIDLHGETSAGFAPAFDDLGGNSCRCGQDDEPCTMLSSGLSPPQEVPEPGDTPTKPDAGL
ncbi:MAG: hypothetical protein JRI23_26205 [Deltaproteobacteria bacterium]|jgi:hypothetical protein|nr:hypothetical protein [Deltaproteobacteria bacterium]MBW2535526.1 hypothetical protein [Deltaproteobacteria bacterium]